MSGLHDGAPDPLAALRATDRRPRTQVWRERAKHVNALTVKSAANRLAILSLVIALGVGVAWRLFLESEPPVEASIPFATNQPVETISGVSNAPAAGESELVGATTPEVAVPAINGVVVHVAGAVVQPGLVTGDSTWRIDDAVRAAGGVGPNADLDRVNLAALISDGQRVFVPFIDEVVPALVQPEATGADGAGAGLNPLVNINSADAAGLEVLPGVGPATAAAILGHREEFGAFGTVDALVAVPGIGSATLERMREYVRV